MMEQRFDIPIVLFMFKRRDTTVKIVNRIAQIKPRKIYILADYARNEQELELVVECRKAVEEAINWDCEIIKNYAVSNRGVYNQIGEGARWVLQREKCAIFLEDDNFPEVTFFEYCKELLGRYETDPKVLWICGTDYLGKYQSPKGDSYMFTQHLLPCGWASWSNKFLKYYDGEMANFKEEKSFKKKIKEKYRNKKLFYQQYRLYEKTEYFMRSDRQKSSWDYQMAFSLRLHDMYGISPCYNQIKNIGVDELSTHGGTTFNNVMTRRFCGMESYPLELPLKHPDKVEIDPEYEKAIGNIILYPWYIRIRTTIGDLLKLVLRVDRNESLATYLRDRKKK